MCMLFLRITAVESLLMTLEGFKVPAQGHVKVTRERFPIWV